MTSDYWFIVAAVVLIVVGGVFAAVDTAVSTVSNARVDDMVREGRAGARRLAGILEARATYVGLVVLLRVVCEAAAVALVAVAATQLIGVGGGLAVAIAAMTVVSYVAVGVGPRTLGRQHAYTIALASSYLLFALGVLLKPLTRLLILIGNALTPGRGFRNGPFATEVELREVVDLAAHDWQDDGWRGHHADAASHDDAMRGAPSGHVLEVREVVGEVTEVGLVDAELLLHRQRGQADLVADDPAAGVGPGADLLELDGIGVLDGQAVELLGERRDRRAGGEGGDTFDVLLGGDALGGGFGQVPIADHVGAGAGGDLPHLMGRQPVPLLVEDGEEQRATTIAATA